MKLEDMRWVRINEQIMTAAKSKDTQISRTKASKHDGLIGDIGEAAFAERFYGDPFKHCNPGAVDFDGLIEVKCSWRPISTNLNLLVRRDYAEKRHPAVYVQAIIDRPDNKPEIEIGDKVYFCGWASHSRLIEFGILKDWGASFTKGASGYECYGLSFDKLSPMSVLRYFVNQLKATA